MHMVARAETAGVRLRTLIGLCGATLALTLPAAAGASGSRAEQVAWIRRASANFVAAELRGDGAGVCSILAASLRATEHHRTCAQRWDARLATLLRDPRRRAALRADAHAVPSAPVHVLGDDATIALPAALISGPNRLRWTEMCWMVIG